MKNSQTDSYIKRFIPYALAAFLIGIVGGLTTVLGPAFVQDMNLNYNNTTWTALSLSLSTAVCSPILGQLSDMWGRRTTLLFGIIIFTIGNILTAIASSLIFMLIARFIVGVGTAAIAPTIMSYIVTEFPPENMAKGFSLYMLISSSAVIFGPSIGVLILESWGWRILMWICVFLSILFFILCLVTHKKVLHKPKKIEHFDSLGAFFVITFFSFLLCIPSFGQNFGWLSSSLIIVTILAVFSLIGLIITEKRAYKPILSSKFIYRQSFILPIIILFLTQGLMQANMTNIIVFVNYTQPNNTAISGYAISIMYLGMALGSILIGPLSDRIEPKRILTVSLILTAIGSGIMLLFSEYTTFILLALSLGMLGFGLGGNATIFMKIVLSHIPSDIAGSGTGIYGLFRDLAIPFGVALFVPMFTNRISNLIEMSGLTVPHAAVNSIHLLSLIELGCIIIGLIIVQFLPKIYEK
ncbi:MAG: MFS transporter [Erysipelotrichales bacterium]|nr:MFS transporter [Erysipelotrichales bacterium]